LEGARLQGDELMLEPGTANEFFKRQIKENLSAITQAAIKVIGRKVTVKLSMPSSPAPLHSSIPQEPSEDASGADILEKAKREPVVKSFLDVFPGPVKANKIHS
jgi:hypothetical protein